MTHWMITLAAAGLAFSALAAWSPGMAGVVGILAGTAVGTVLVARNTPAHALERARVAVAAPRAGRRS